MLPKEDKLLAIQLLAKESDLPYFYLNSADYIELGGVELNKVHGRIFCISQKIPQDSIFAANTCGFLSAEYMEDLAVPMMKILGKK